jgi:phosphatidylinositol alpha-1,6-mannosyltransferase
LTGRALLLTPSRGLGGGIERYAQTLEWAFTAQDIEYRRVDLRGTGPAAHARLLSEGRGYLRASPAPARLVVVHRALLPVASLLARGQSCRGLSLVCHGIEGWGERWRPRPAIETLLMRRPGVRAIAASSFTAGALLRDSPATVLPPGLSEAWFGTLVDAASAASAVRPRDPGIQLLTVFRLADWRDKGLPQLLDAVAAVAQPDVRVTVCGSGDPPADLRRLVGQHPRCVLRCGVSDADLARELASADLFVLATRTRHGRTAYGEGFGLVLLEAQVAGTPVIAPAHAGSHDAYLEGISGVAPADESAEALARVLGDLLRDRQRLTEMGQRAADWARESFAPQRYASLAVARLL